jgi:hypothetical protein
MRGRANRKKLIAIVIAIAIAIILLLKVFSLFKSEPERVVKEFYSYEAEGEFGKSWGLFHSGMKKKFPKRGDYIQNREHVFMQHMEVDTFTFEVGNAKKRKQWKMRSEAGSLYDVYEVPVTQSFDSRFGKFELKQSCFVTKEKGEWKVLWDYNF